MFKWENVQQIELRPIENGILIEITHNMLDDIQHFEPNLSKALDWLARRFGCGAPQ